MTHQIDTLLSEVRRFPPPPEFTGHANVKGMEGYRELYRQAAERPEDFWAELAEKEL